MWHFSSPREASLPIIGDKIKELEGLNISVSGVLLQVDVAFKFYFFRWMFMFIEYIGADLSFAVTGLGECDQMLLVS